MKNLFKITLLSLTLLLISSTSYATKIIIDVKGSGGVTMSFLPGGTVHYEFDCETSDDCCGTIEFEMPSSDIRGVIGAPTVLKDTEGTRDNVIHEWHGVTQALYHNSNNPSYLGVIMSNSVQVQ
jgi:hypothetical protein